MGGGIERIPARLASNFPSFSEGLSLRVRFAEHALTSQRRFPFLLGRAFIEANPPHLALQNPPPYFPSFWEGLSLRRRRTSRVPYRCRGFPFLLGRAFIEAQLTWVFGAWIFGDFPSFWEGLSLRRYSRSSVFNLRAFPCLFDGAFIEDSRRRREHRAGSGFPYNFGGTFIEAHRQMVHINANNDFPAFS